jgi:Ca2+/Na+ antiporter
MASYISNLKLPSRDKAIETLTSSKDKYYLSIIIAILLLIMGLFYYLNEMQNIFKIKNTKYEIFMWLFLVAFSIYTFLFYVYKHKYDNYNTIKPDTSFINMYKYVGLLFLIILFPVLTINFILYLHKTNNSVFNITQNILGILIVIVIFAKKHIFSYTFK